MDQFEEAFDNQDLKRLQLLIYLVPVFGLVPALWRLSQRKCDRQHRTVSRLSVTLALSWLLAYLLLNTSASVSSEAGWQVSLLLLNGLVTSSYFLTSLWLMVQVWQKQPPHLPGFSRIAKHLP